MSSAQESLACGVSNRCTVDSPLYYMKRGAGNHGSGSSRHVSPNGVNASDVDGLEDKNGVCPHFKGYLRSTHHIIATAESRKAIEGITAAASGGQFCSRPMCENRLFSMWKKMPSMMPKNTFTPTMPARACM